MPTTTTCDLILDRKDIVREALLVERARCASGSRVVAVFPSEHGNRLVVVRLISHLDSRGYSVVR